jgi:hypothetical protein
MRVCTQLARRLLTAPARSQPHPSDGDLVEEDDFHAAGGEVPDFIGCRKALALQARHAVQFSVRYLLLRESSTL